MSNSTSISLFSEEVREKEIEISTTSSDFNICDTNSVEKNCHKDPSKIIGSLRQKHTNRLIIGQLNINSIRNKFDSLNGILKNNIDVLLLSETKIDSSFPKVQFEIDGFTVYRCDRNEDGGGLLLYVRNDIPSDLVQIKYR